MNRDEFDNYTGLRCMFCGEAEVVDLMEVWHGHEFMLDTCCEALHESILDDMRDDPKYSAQLLRRLGVEVVMGAQLRRVAACVEGYRLDCKLEIRPIEQAGAKLFVREHHRHCKPPAGWRFGAGIWNAWTLIGVVMVGRPVARGFDPSRAMRSTASACVLTCRASLPGTPAANSTAGRPARPRNGALSASSPTPWSQSPVQR